MSLLKSIIFEAYLEKKLSEQEMDEIANQVYEKLDLADLGLEAMSNEIKIKNPEREAFLYKKEFQYKGIDDIYIKVSIWDDGDTQFEISFQEGTIFKSNRRSFNSVEDMIETTSNQLVFRTKKFLNNLKFKAYKISTEEFAALLKKSLEEKGYVVSEFKIISNNSISLIIMNCKYSLALYESKMYYSLTSLDSNLPKLRDYGMLDFSVVDFDHNLEDMAEYMSFDIIDRVKKLNA
jgi:hypothetical protein